MCRQCRRYHRRWSQRRHARRRRASLTLRWLRWRAVVLCGWSPNRPTGRWRATCSSHCEHASRRQRRARRWWSSSPPRRPSCQTAPRCIERRNSLPTSDRYWRWKRKKTTTMTIIFFSVQRNFGQTTNEKRKKWKRHTLDNRKSPESDRRADRPTELDVRPKAWWCRRRASQWSARVASTFDPVAHTPDTARRQWFDADSPTLPSAT